MTDRTNIHLGRRLRQRRRILGLTQADIAADVGVSFQQIQKYECGASRISAVMLWKIACVLETSVASFFEGLEPHHAPSATIECVAVPGRANHFVLNAAGRAAVAAARAGDAG